MVDINNPKQVETAIEALMKARWEAEGAARYLLELRDELKKQTKLLEQILHHVQHME